MMLATLIQKEARDLLSTSRFAATFGASALLILLAFYVGAQNHRLALTQNEAAMAENLRQMEGLTDWLGLEQYRIMLPPRPLEALVSGVSSDIGRTAEVKTRGEITPENSRYNEDPIFAVFRFLDLGFIFQIVLSLFAILLAYDAISGEKERGTLRLTFAHPVPRATYLLGKIIGAFGTLALSLLVAIGLGCLLLPIMGVHLSGDEWTRLGLIVLAGLLYFGAFLALAVLVSASTHRSSTAFLLLLVIWIGSVLIVPRVSVLLAGRSVDVPSVDEISARKATYARQLWREFRDGLKSFHPPEGGDPDNIEAVLGAFNTFQDSLTAERDRKAEVFNDRLNEDRANRQVVRERVAFDLARVSPASSLLLATTALAGTSLDLKDRFYREATAYRQGFNAFLKEKTGMNVGGRTIMWRVNDDQKEPEPIDPGEIPTFAFRGASLAESVTAALPDLGLLALFNLLFFAGAFIVFLRYDVR
jgi:ABC-type transport system involved in multi-copper enzyme maturation permease subunit